ncbi:MAG TPA: 2-oxoacid:acceptor oxidoreductase family protein [Spirochaetota bacterium]|nr:2-oxoacid:acceptor oxidoreductase family protein [Spirochaetota bacterium]HOL56475.1 2-oxoacid:acceptor oxidoreductase family protein [Spirochaetota bacterium]HPP03398.1 2-oxoacid:acceptor oxidoreductase family protein [Spirochaetota bacterium]
MINRIIIAGFGGQGIIIAGKILATAFMNEGKEVTFFPSYGAEMRGGTCNCSVVVSDNPIASPIIHNPDTLLLFNKPSMDKFERLCKKDGIIIFNSSLIKEKSKRSDIRSFYINASNIAEESGTIKGTNMAMLGAFAKITGLVKIDSLKESIKENFKSLKEELLKINIDILLKGYEFNFNPS